MARKTETAAAGTATGSGNDHAGALINPESNAAEAKPQARSWRDTLPIHPAAQMFPLMSEADLRELGEDIKRNGLHTPITLCLIEDKSFVLDGRNRLDAMQLV